MKGYILHRDLVICDSMYEDSKEVAFGILNDFDLSRTSNANETSSNHRTGTAQFMGHELLYVKKPVEHLYRHDLEPFLYILIWTAVGYKGQHHPRGKGGPLIQWCLGDWRRVLCEITVLFFSANENYRIIDHIAEGYEVMRHTIIHLHSILTSAFCLAIIARHRIRRDLAEGIAETDEIRRKSNEEAQELLSDDKVSYLFNLSSAGTEQSSNKET